MIEAKCKVLNKKKPKFLILSFLSWFILVSQEPADAAEDGYLVLSPLTDDMNLQCYISPRMQYLLKLPGSSDLPPTAYCNCL